MMITSRIKPRYPLAIERLLIRRLTADLKKVSNGARKAIPALVAFVKQNRQRLDADDFVMDRDALIATGAFAAAVDDIIDEFQQTVKDETGDESFDVPPDEMSGTEKYALWLILMACFTQTNDFATNYFNDQLNDVLGTKLVGGSAVSPVKVRYIKDNFVDTLARKISYLMQDVTRRVQDVLVEALTPGGIEGEELLNKTFRDAIATFENVGINSIKRTSIDAIGNLYSVLTQANMQARGITSYQWRTMRDNRVRPTHAERDNKVYDWNEDSPNSVGNREGGRPPGREYHCRCIASSVFETGKLQEQFGAFHNVNIKSR